MRPTASWETVCSCASRPPAHRPRAKTCTSPLRRSLPQFALGSCGLHVGCTAVVRLKFRNCPGSRSMRAVLLTLPLAALILGCAGHTSNRPVAPSGGSPLTGTAVPPAPDLAGLDSLLPLASGADSQLVAADVAAERRQAADSAADEAVLEELADARPDSAADRSGDEESDAQPG